MRAAIHMQRERERRQIRVSEVKQSESSDSLDVLSGKLQTIRDIDELTKMLRAASEYEERKMIRAAIRQIRDEQLQVLSGLCEAPVTLHHCDAWTE
ncbi:hypothetical protein PAMP_022618 [Pampus punctatissimus]